MYTVIIWCLIALFLLQPGLAREGAVFGIELFTEALLPYLLPYLILTQWLLRLPAKEPKRRTGTYWKTYLLGAFGGFPVGAVSVSHQVKDGRLSTREGALLTAICHAPSSMLLIGYVGNELFGRASVGWLLMAVIHGLNLIFLLILSVRTALHPERRQASVSIPKRKSGSPLTESLKESSQTIVLVATTVVFFSAVGTVAADLVARLSPLDVKTAGMAVFPLFEMTAGLQTAHDLFSGMDLHAALTALILSMNGLSIHLQVAVIARGAGIPMRWYAAARLAHMIIVPPVFMLLLSLWN